MRGYCSVYIAPLPIGHGAVDEIGLSSPPTTVAGAVVPFGVVARDTGGQIVTNYSGTLSFTTSDIDATIPSNTGLSNGSGRFTATLRNLGTQSLTATDVATATLVGSDNTVVGVGAIHLSVVLVSPLTLANNAGDDIMVNVGGDCWQAG